MAAPDGGIDNRNDCVGGFAEDGLYIDGERGEKMLLREAEERKAPVQTYGQNTRQMLLQRHVADNCGEGR
jgi:hypothetical protein